MKSYITKACPRYPKRTLCTKQKYCTLSIENREVLVDQMRNRLQTREGRKKYLQRIWPTDPVFRYLEYDLDYRNFF
ncbi:MAG: hypothetical protein ACOWWR_09760 [Eubacteriales bacterium]